MYFITKLFMVASLSLSLFLASADLNAAGKPKLIKIGNFTATGGPGFSAQSFRSGGSGSAGYLGILSNKGFVTNNNSFGGEVKGRAKGSVTHGFLRDQLSVLERDDGDIGIVRSEMDAQWQDAEGNQYDFQGIGFFKGKLDVLLKFFTTGGLAPLLDPLLTRGSGFL